MSNKSAGKGHYRRSYNRKKYEANFDAIKWGINDLQPINKERSTEDTSKPENNIPAHPSHFNDSENKA